MNRGAKKRNTRDAIAELARKREERRRSASDYKRNRLNQIAKNEREGRPGDVDFQRMIEQYRTTTGGNTVGAVCNIRASSTA